MGLISTSIPNLINGISQQNAVQRNVGQAELQSNFQSNVIEGLTKRPPTEFIANLLSTTAFPNNAAVHWINRDSDNQYVAIFTNGTVKVYNLQGQLQTLTIGTGGASYLGTTKPIEDLVFTNIADYTFVGNRSKTISETSTTTTAKVQEYISYVKSSQFLSLIHI